ncbi:C25 family cysteine peptidase [Marinicella sp. W31]|uniref:C25 family cysteine peptidase n=1 Tax=Marinicella sp. W31 TaxID=3023713 RepID=UPI00375689E2
MQLFSALNAKQIGKFYCVRSAVLLYSLFVCASSGFGQEQQRFDAESVIANSHIRAHFNIYVGEDAVYRIKHEHVAPHLANRVLSFEHLQFTMQGEPIDFHINDDGDGIWQSGDSIEFIGHHARGQSSWLSPISSINVYQLWFDVEHVRGQSASSAITHRSEPALNQVERGNFLIQQHLEQENLQLPMSHKDALVDDTRWYWGKLQSLAQAPLSLPIQLSAQPQSEMQLRVRLRGWSSVKNKQKGLENDHQVAVYFNNQWIKNIHWNGRSVHTAEFGIDGALWSMETDQNKLAFKVIDRLMMDQVNPVIDVVYLDWIELNYAHAGEITNTTPLRLHAQTQTQYRLNIKQNTSYQLTSDTGERLYLETGSHDVSFQKPMAFYLQPTDTLLEPLDIRYVAAKKMPVMDNIDYLMISHPAFTQGIKPLLSYYQSQGHNLLLLNTDDIYDVYGHGVFSAEAIKQAIDATYQTSAETLEHVLLIGDASWFREDSMALYAQHLDDLLQFNLLPSWQVHTPLGPAASDGQYVQFNKLPPTVAVGRFPVNTDAQLKAMVDKTIAYQTTESWGRWKTRIGLLSGALPELKLRNQKIINGLASGHRYSTSLLDDGNISRVTQAFERHLLMHFYGHGGRYMWQFDQSQPTQPADFFDRSDIAALNNQRWPFVLSMTCSSGPFDHPSAESLAELLLAREKAGAVGLIASAARNDPPVRFSQKLINHLTDGYTVGQALLKARGQYNPRTQLATYNVLGDPALTLKMSSHAIEFEKQADGTIQIHLPIDDFSGTLLITEIGQAGVSEQPIEHKGTRFSFTPSDGIMQLQIYTYDPLKKTDAFGLFDVTQEIKKDVQQD